MAQKKTVAIVTGSSRGAGRGAAIALGSHGCKVYVTGRSERRGDATPLPGTIHETADAVTAAGGEGIAVRCDHSDDEQIKALIEQVLREEGQIDILVNNAAAIYDELTHPGNFWEKPLKLVDLMDVGLRSGYVASYYAARSMVQQRHGLIVFTSGPGSVHYVYGPAYGAHKAGMDKFAADMAIDLHDHNVAAMSVWMGALKTDRLKMVMESDPEKYGHLNEILESPELTGHVIWGLYNDKKLMDLSGQTVIVAEMAVEYGIKDEGRDPVSYRTRLKVEPRVQYPIIIR